MSKSNAEITSNLEQYWKYTLDHTQTHYVLYRVPTNPKELDYLEGQKAVFGKDFSKDCSKLTNSELNTLAIQQVGMNENANSTATGISTPFTSFKVDPNKGFGAGSGNYIAILIPKDKVNLYKNGTQYVVGRQPLIAGEDNEILVPNGVPVGQVVYFIGRQQVNSEVYRQKLQIGLEDTGLEKKSKEKKISSELKKKVGQIKQTMGTKSKQKKPQQQQQQQQQKQGSPSFP